MLSAKRRRAVHAASIGIWLTGAVWLVFKYFVTSTDSFGFEGPHPLQKWWLIAHAAFSFWGVWLFGMLWPGHVLRGWRSHLKRPTGGTLFGVATWLTLTGCALYYIGNDTARSWTSILHWAVGLAALVAFLLHSRKAGQA
jgi:hypothetical protein